MFRRYQSDDVTRNQSNYSATMLCWLGPFWSCSVFNHSINSATVLQAVLQVNAEPLRNWLIEMMSGLGTLRVPAKVSTQMKSCQQTSISYTFKHEIMNFYYINLSELMNSLKTFRLWKPLLFVVMTIFHCVGARLSTLMSDFDRLGRSIFGQEMGNARPMRKEMDEKVFFPPELAFSFFG